MRLRNVYGISMETNTSKENPYEALLEFFPNANVRLLDDIADFHTRFIVSLQSDLEESYNKAQSELANLDAQIQEKVEMLSKFDDFGDITMPFLKAYSSLQLEKSDCLRKIELIEKKTQFSKDAAKYKNELKPLETKLMNEIKTSINVVLEKLSRSVFDDDDSLVKIDFPTLTSSVLETEYDDGTSTDFSGLLLFDLALLQTTCLPTVVHDSYWFSNIKGNRAEKVFELHNAITQKQIFISIDEVEKYSVDIQKMLYEKMVLLLESGGGELYGRNSPNTAKQTAQNNV